MDEQPKRPGAFRTLIPYILIGLIAIGAIFYFVSSAIGGNNVWAEGDIDTYLRYEIEKNTAGDPILDTNGEASYFYNTDYSNLGDKEKAYLLKKASKFGFFASLIALPLLDSLIPNPSIMQRIIGLFFINTTSFNRYLF